MRHLGNVRTKKMAIAQCRPIVKETGNTCVIEKAKCTSWSHAGIEYSSPRKKFVCYRAWLDREDHRGLIMSIQQWQREHEREERRWHRTETDRRYGRKIG